MQGMATICSMCWHPSRSCYAQSVSKPGVKRHKSDAVDAEAICVAVTRANKRFGQY